MRIQFALPEGEDEYRDWPCPPRRGDYIRLRRRDYIVESVNWGDHLTGIGDPIGNKPFACVVLVDAYGTEY